MKTLLVALLLLVVGTGTAFAECAWVLWNEITFAGPSSSSSHLFLIVASPTHEQCEQSRIAKARQFLRITESDRSGSNVANVTVKEQGNIVTKTTHLKDGSKMLEVHRLSCLPDTIDPRGPKGK